MYDVILLNSVDNKMYNLLRFRCELESNSIRGAVQKKSDMSAKALTPPPTLKHSMWAYM